MNPLQLLRPTETSPTIFDIDFEELLRAGKRAILFDLDNTLRKRWAPTLLPGGEELLVRLRDMGFRLAVITNRKRIARDPLLRRLVSQMNVIYHAKKPNRGSFLSLLSRLRVQPEEAVMVGDRRLTDVLGANRLGIYAILLTHAGRKRGAKSETSRR